MNTQNRSAQGYLSNLAGGQGENAVSTLFQQWGWIPRKISGDFDQGIDLHVEIGNDGQGQGYHFDASVKASDGRAPVREPIGIDLKKGSVAYVQRQVGPVFLFFAKLRFKTVYWVNLKDAIGSGRVNKSGGVRISIPQQNAFYLDLEDAQRAQEREILLAALEESEGWCVPRFDVVPLSIGKREKALANLDPRCDVRITATSDGTTYQVTTREPIDLHLSIKTSTQVDHDQLLETFRFGATNTVSVDRMEFKGSPTFEKLSSGGSKGVLKFENAAPFRLAFLAGPASQGGNHPGRLRFSGDFTRGAHGAQGTASSLENPLGVFLRIDAIKRRLTFKFINAPEKWAGRSLLAMSGLKYAATVVQAMSESSSFELKLLPEIETPIFQEELSQEMASGLLLTAGYLQDLDNLREIALRYVDDICLGTATQWNFNEMQWWRIARSILDGDTVEVPLKTLELNLTESNGEFPEGWDQGIFATQSPLHVEAFGQKLCEIPVDVYVQDYSPSSNGGVGVTSIQLTRLPTSRLYMRRASGEPLDKLVPKNDDGQTLADGNAPCSEA